MYIHPVSSEMLAILSSAENTCLVRHCAQVAVGFDILSLL